MYVYVSKDGRLRGRGRAGNRPVYGTTKLISYFLICRRGRSHCPRELLVHVRYVICERGVDQLVSSLTNRLLGIPNSYEGMI